MLRPACYTEWKLCTCTSIVTVYFVYINRCINGGKSNLNEDQSSFKQYFVDLEICELKEVSAESAEIGKETEMQAIGKVPVGYSLLRKLSLHVNVLITCSIWLVNEPVVIMHTQRQYWISGY